MITLEARSASELFTKAVRAVLSSGRPVQPRGLDTRELLGVALHLTNPRRRFISVPPMRLLNPAFAAAETTWILSGSDESWIYTYNSRMAEFADDGVLRGAYGPRLRSWRGLVDQLDQARKLLISDPDTRRAVIQLYDPDRDSAGHRDVPCTLGYRFFLREGRLHMHTTMRSQDLWLGFCYDIFAATVMHELMAGWVGAELGSYLHFVDSLHLYAEHIPLAAALPDDPEPSPAMPDLAITWSDFDELLRAVIAGETPHHSGWAEFSQVMVAYRYWKAGHHTSARELARQSTGTLAGALSLWYDHLTTKTSSGGAP